MYLDEILPWRAATFASLQHRNSASPSLSSLVTLADNPAILTKVALLYVRCLVGDYPESWPTGVTALLELWSNRRNAYHQSINRRPNGVAQGLEEIVELQKYVTMTQFFLSVMEAFDDEVVIETVSRPQKEKNRNMAVRL